MYYKIRFEGEDYYEIGCKNCKKRGFWSLFTDEKDFVAKCKCGHVTKINHDSIVPESELT